MNIWKSFFSLGFALIHCLVFSVFSTTAQTIGSDVDSSDVRFAYKAKSFVLPFELLNGRHIGVKVRINGKGPFLFVLDTGFGGNIVVSSEVARSLNLKQSGEPVEVSGFGENKVIFTQADAAVVQVGDVDLLNQRLNVVPENNVLPGIDGVLTYEFIKKFVIEINYQDKTLTLSKLKHLETSASGSNSDDFISIDLSDENIPLVKAVLDGEEGVFAIDTGSKDSIILYPAFVSRNNLDKKYSTRALVTGRGIGGLFHLEVARSSNLRIGKFSLNRILVYFLDQKSQSMRGVDGIIGFGLLKRFNVVLSYADSYIKLSKNENYDKPDIFSRLGFFFDIASGVVVEVLPKNDLANQVNIAVGDVIISIDGEPISALGLSGLESKITKSPGTVLKILLKKKNDENPHKIDLILKDYL